MENVAVTSFSLRARVPAPRRWVLWDTGVTGSCEPPVGTLALSTGPEEQRAFLTTEPPLQPLFLLRFSPSLIFSICFFV